jgi:hypothetical protein
MVNKCQRVARNAPCRSATAVLPSPMSEVGLPYVVKARFGGLVLVLGMPKGKAVLAAA